MKTNLVKKGSEKNIEMFKMSNDELVKVTGGEVLIAEGTGRPIIIIRGEVMNFRSTYLRAY